MMCPIFFGGFGNKKAENVANRKVTFEEGYNKYLDNCRQRNLRDLINHASFLDSAKQLLELLHIL